MLASRGLASLSRCAAPRPALRSFTGTAVISPMTQVISQTDRPSDGPHRATALVAWDQPGKLDATCQQQGLKLSKRDLLLSVCCSPVACTQGTHTLGARSYAVQAKAVAVGDKVHLQSGRCSHRPFAEILTGLLVCSCQATPNSATSTMTTTCRTSAPMTCSRARRCHGGCCGRAGHSAAVC